MKKIYRYQAYKYTYPEGCSCAGCCAVVGIDKPQERYRITEYSSDGLQEIINTPDKEEFELFKNQLGITGNDKYVLRYFDELKRSMEMLAENEKVIFLGQACAVPGTGMFNTIKDIDISRRIELPVCEEMETGMATGIALNGFIPVLLHPRWNFLLLAVNQLVNHLDKLELMSNGEFKPKVIIRTAIGSQRPLHPQHQHVGDFTDAFRLMCKTIKIVRLDEPEQIFPAYEAALANERSTILVEWGDYYNEK